MAESGARLSSRYEMGQTTRSEWESDMRAHRELLRNVIEEHREGRDGVMSWGEMIDELAFEEETVYPPTSALGSANPPSSAQGPSGWIYHSTSLGCLRPHHFPRRVAIMTVESAIFDPLILLTIMCNCITMAWASPMDPPGTVKQDILAVLEWVYLYIFTFELTMKIIAYGFIGHKHSYLRDAWCQLDFVVVSLAWLPILFPEAFGNMSAIRSVRALRPLRALKRVPGMPVLIGSIMQSLPPLGNVAALSAFLFLIFGIIGMNLFKGLLHYRCADTAVYSTPGLPDPPKSLLAGANAEQGRRNLLDALAPEPVVQLATGAAASLAAASLPHFERLMSSTTKRSGRALKGGGGGGGQADPNDPEVEFDTETLCAADTGMCAEEGTSCYYFSNNPGGGTISFDTVPMTFIAILQAVTFDTWTDPMFDIMDSYSYSAWIYFILVAILGGMFVVNLFLAVIFDEFIRAQEANAQEAEATKGPEDEDGIHEIDEVAALIKQKKELSDGQIKAGQRGCCDCTPDGGCRAWLRDIVYADWFGNISTGFVVFNLVIMCMPYYRQPADYEALVEGLSTFVTWVFIVEMFLKLVAMGCAEYWGDGWNTLDGVIVTLSIGEILITIFLADTGINISFLRMLRLLRLLRLLKAWPALYKIVMAFVKAVPQISNLFVLMFLLMFIFSLLGMQTFGGTDVSIDSRWHFDYFYSAMLTTFGIFTGAWVDAFQVCASVVGLGITIAFFVPALIIGFFIIMNLFIAILLEAFAEEDEEEEEEEEAAGEGEAGGGDEAAAAKAGGSDAAPLSPAPSLPPPAPAPPASPPLSPTLSPGRDPLPLLGVSCWGLGPESELRLWCQGLAESKNFDTFIIFLIVASSICLALDVPRLDPLSDLKATLDILNYCFTALFIFEMSIKIVAYGFFWSSERAYLKQGWNILDFVIVMISILGLFADLVPAFGQLKSLRILRVLRPLRLLQRNPGMKLVITSLVQTLPSVVDVFSVVFVFHLVFAILGMQLFGGMWGACTDDSITVRELCVPARARQLEALPALAAPHAAAPGFAADSVAAAGGHRSLAYTPRSATLFAEAGAASKYAIVEEENGTAQAEASLGHAVADEEAARQRRLQAGRLLNEKRRQMFKRSYRDAAQRRRQLAEKAADGGLVVEGEVGEVDEEREVGEELHGRALSGRELKGGPTSGADGPQLPTQWLNPPYGSFDDFSHSLLILYIAATGDGWEEFMWMGMDSVGPGKAPERNDFSPASIFFLAWMIVGCFISINLFVGAIVDNFTRIKQESDGSATMTPEQQQWADSLKATVSAQALISPKRPNADETLRVQVFELVTAEKFNFVVIGVIVLNVFAMAFEFDRMPADYELAYSRCMLFFTYFYYCECVLKIFGLGAYYFQDGWCRFDFFLVTTSFLDQFFSELLMQFLPIPPTVLRVMRVARVLRILRLLKNLKGLRDLVFTLVLAFPGLMNVGALLALVMFMYAVLGMQLFTFLMPGGALNEGGRNFVTFGNSMLLLFQCLTGDGWSEMMDDAMVSEERGCDPLAVPSDCGSPLSIPYFISFTVIGSFVMLNLVVAVILENFTALGNVNGDLVSSNDIADFKEAWGVYDPDADGMISVIDLPKLLVDLPPPLGLRGTKDHGRPLKICLKLGLMQVRNPETGIPEVAFKPVLDALIQRNYEGKVEVPSDSESVDSPAIAALLLERSASLGEASSHGSFKAGEPFTPRRSEMRQLLAEEVLARGVGAYKSKKSVRHPLSPMGKGAAAAAPAAAAAAQALAPAAAGTAAGTGKNRPPLLGKGMDIAKLGGGAVSGSRLPPSVRSAPASMRRMLASGMGLAPKPGKGRNGTPLMPEEGKDDLVA